MLILDGNPDLCAIGQTLIPLYPDRLGESFAAIDN